MKSTNHTNIILFDGDCVMCSAAARFIAVRDPDGIFQLGALESERGAELRKEYGCGDDVDSILLIEDGVCYRQTAACLRITRKLRALWPLLYLLVIVPPFIRNSFYRLIARNRYRWFGKNDACPLPPPDLEDRFFQ